MIKVKIGDAVKKSVLASDEPKLTMKLNARTMIDGSIFIHDHPEIDIVLKPSEMKVITWPKSEFGDHIYDAQNRLFAYFIKKGLIYPEMVKGGNVHAVLETVYPESQIGGKASDIMLFAIAKFLEEEKPVFEYMQAIEDQEEERLLEPDQEHSTELGEVPQAEVKGTLPTGKLRRYPIGSVAGSNWG
jgi:hypothetical protein